jgi:hypothetical protein
MSDNPFVGSWTYRSLINNPAVDTDFRLLQFGRGTLIIKVAPMEQLVGTIGGPGWSLELKGARSYGDPMHARFRGTGTVDDEPWVYDYTGWLIPAWPNGVGQVPAIVGSVIRTIPHSAGPGKTAPAGEVASFYAVRSA